MKLELKHLESYLSSNLKCNITGLDSNQWYNVELTSLSTIESYEHACFLDMRKGKDRMPGELSMIHIENIQPILRPLSDLTKEIRIQGVNRGLFFIPASDLFRFYDPKKTGLEIDLSEQGIIELWIADYKTGVIDETLILGDYMKLFKWHFDVFGLIPEGLAIDVNTI